LDAVPVLGVDGMPVAAIGSFPAVVVDDAAVQFAVGGAGPEADPLAGVVNDQIDVLAVVAGIDVQSAPGAFELTRMGATLAEGGVGLGDEYLQAPNPQVSGGLVDVEPAVDGDAGGRGRADVDRMALVAGELDIEEFVGPPLVSPRQQIDGIARANLA